MRRIALHAWILTLLTGLLASNLESGPIDDVLEPVIGRWFAAFGLRQYWTMFAPNPVHDASFVRVEHIAPDGTRTVLHADTEPPFPPAPWLGVGYDRSSKWDSAVARKPAVLGKSTAEAWCRLEQLDGRVAVTVIRYTTPRPAERRAGVPITRTEAPAGEWSCR